MDSHFPRLGQMIVDYDHPIRKMTEEFVPLGKVSSHTVTLSLVKNRVSYLWLFYYRYIYVRDDFVALPGYFKTQSINNEYNKSLCQIELLYSQ